MEIYLEVFFPSEGRLLGIPIPNIKNTALFLRVLHEREKSEMVSDERKEE